MNEVIHDAEVVEEGQEGQELVPAPSTNLFRTDDPGEVLDRAQDAADKLMSVVRAKNLSVQIQGREHLKVEAWQTLGTMLGVTGVCTWTNKLENGWEARVEARTLDGRVIGAAEAECLRSERQWKERDDFALKSMAQTRAMSKALASVLRFIATLGGVEGTPAEEMPRGATSGGGDGAPKVSSKQAQFIATLLDESPISSEARAKFNAWAPDNLTGGREGTASALIEVLKNDKEKGADMAAQMCGYSDVPLEAEPEEPAPTDDDSIPF